MLHATLCFLTRKKNGKINKILLGRKKKGFGINKWGGAGGKVGDNFKSETIEEAAIRETKEEIKVKANNIIKVAELTFLFPYNPGWGQIVHVFLVNNWTGRPAESEEVKPKWFNTKSIPFHQMWADGKYWLPEVLKNNKLKGKFVFDGKENIIARELNFIDKFL